MELNKNYLPADKWRGGCIEEASLMPLAELADRRGWLVELFRNDELEADYRPLPVMAYLSCTRPDVVRGPHEHADQTDYFVFLHGHGTLYLWDNRPKSMSYGVKAKFDVGYRGPMRAIVPPGVVHAYRCEGLHDLLVFNAPDKLYAGVGKKEAVDEVRHEKDPNTVFKIW